MEQISKRLMNYVVMNDAASLVSIDHTLHQIVNVKGDRK